MLTNAPLKGADFVAQSKKALKQLSKIPTPNLKTLLKKHSEKKPSKPEEKVRKRDKKDKDKKAKKDKSNVKIEPVAAELRHTRS